MCYSRSLMKGCNHDGQINFYSSFQCGLNYFLSLHSGFELARLHHKLRLCFIFMLENLSNIDCRYKANKHLNNTDLGTGRWNLSTCGCRRRWNAAGASSCCWWWARAGWGRWTWQERHRRHTLEHTNAMSRNALFCKSCTPMKEIASGSTGVHTSRWRRCLATTATSEMWMPTELKSCLHFPALMVLWE